MFDQLSFKVDVNSEGKEVLKNQDVNQETQQRAKCLNGEVPVQQREQVQAEAQAKVDRLNADKVTKYETILERNQVCESKLAPTLPKDATVDMFSKIKCEYVKAFIHCRTYNTHRSTAKWPKKGVPADGLQTAGEDGGQAGSGHRQLGL